MSERCCSADCHRVAVTRAAGIQYCRECWREILVSDCQHGMYFMIEHALEYKVIGGGCSLEIAGFDRA